FRETTVCLSKGFKDMSQKFWRYTGASIPNNNSSLRLDPFYFDLHVPPLGGELHCVGQEIAKDLLKPVFISKSFENRRSVQDYFELHTFSFKRWMDRIYSCLDHRY